MKRRKWKPEQKALIVLEGLKGRPIGDLCAEHEISQAQYYSSAAVVVSCIVTSTNQQHRPERKHAGHDLVPPR